jgi:hypothetical protein
MIVIGTFIRGPGWMWFWPTQTWDHNRLEFAVNRNLDQVFGIDGAWLAHILPSGWKAASPLIARGIFGIFPVGIFVIVAAYFIHWLMMRTEFSRKIYKRMTLLQIITVQAMLIPMIALPVKILLRLVLRVKYIWVTPWFTV